MVDRTTSSLPFSAEISDKYPVYWMGNGMGLGLDNTKGLFL